MATEIIVQVAVLVLTLAVFYTLHYFSKQPLTRLRAKTRTTIQTDRHLAQANRLLGRAKSMPDKAKSETIAKKALAEAQTAISLSPRDPQPHILKARVLEFMGHQSSALGSLDLALRLPRVKSLSGKERGDLLVKRAELKLVVNKRRRVDSAVEDLKEAIRLTQGECDHKVFSLLSECQEFKGMKDEAQKIGL